MFTVIAKTTNRIMANVPTTDEALIAEASGFRVEAHGKDSVLALARARCNESPDYNMLPEDDERYVKYKSKSGRTLVCEVVRLTHPDAEGYPQLLELMSLGRQDTSFVASASSCEVLDRETLSPDLWLALTSGETEVVEAKPVKIRHGLRRD